ncbi:hypothetical protein [Thalassospira mesophila]|uniref:Uncharacterized protein n=1 Tax=Thalassospira mesophila TaxID=1293891 RepID=A0A1Y2L0T6_9PROT|nr:hypothetical protein [Thalassospira mesophila]OSQ38836.1 hypothetical protein TMES_08680 [Thalassospira mesophila]
MEEREKPEREPQRKPPSAYVSDRKLQQDRRVLSPASKSSLNRYDRSEAIERDLENKKAAAIERLASKGIIVTRIGPETKTGNTRVPDQYIWETTTPHPQQTGTQPDELANQSPSGEDAGKDAVSDHQADNGDVPRDMDGVTNAGVSDQAPLVSDTTGTPPAQADDLRSRLTQVPHIEPSVSAINPDLTDMAIEHHGLRLPDHKPATPKAKIPVETTAPAPVHSGRRRATSESYAELEAQPARTHHAAEKTNRSGVERWAPRIGAYMIAAVAVGYVLVLTLIELYSLF